MTFEKSHFSLMTLAVLQDQPYRRFRIASARTETRAIASGISGCSQRQYALFCISTGPRPLAMLIQQTRKLT